MVLELELLLLVEMERDKVLTVETVGRAEAEEGGMKVSVAMVGTVVSVNGDRRNAEDEGWRVEARSISVELLVRDMAEAAAEVVNG